MSAASSCRSYVVAASIATVEALKDQGFARWNYPLKTLHNRLKSNLKSSSVSHQSSKAKAVSSSSGSEVGSEITKMTLKKREMNIKKVMEIDCFGPPTFRF